MEYKEATEVLTYLKLLDALAPLELKNKRWINLEGVKSYTFRNLNGAGCISPVSADKNLIMFHGSNDFFDFLMDAILFKVPYYSKDKYVGTVHTGFLTAWEIVKQQALEAVMEVDPRREKKYILQGHSLGAPLAIFMALELKALGYNVERIYSFGAPRVGNKEMAKYVREELEITRIVNGYDLVPLLPIPVSWIYDHFSDDQLFLIKGNITSNDKYRYGAFAYLGRSIDDHMLDGYISSFKEVLKNLKK